MAAKGWALLTRIVDVIVWFILALIIILGTVAYFAVKKAFRTVDDIVASVKTGTSKLVSEVVTTLKSTNGLFQGVQHQVGDLILFVKNGIDSGLHKVTKEYDLVKSEVKRIHHYITDGDWADTQIFADFEKKFHKIINSTLSFPETRDFTVNGVTLDTIGVSNIYHDLVRFKMKSFDTATCLLNLQVVANALQDAGIDGSEKLYVEIDKRLFKLNEQLITLTNGITDTGSNYRITFNRLVSEVDQGIQELLKTDISWTDLL
jgi:hypothetical protein